MGDVKRSQIKQIRPVGAFNGNMGQSTEAQGAEQQNVINADL